MSILSTCLKQKLFRQYNGIHLVNMKQLIFTGIEKNSSFVSGKNNWKSVFRHLQMGNMNASNISQMFDCLITS